MPNIFDPLFDEPREHPGFDCVYPDSDKIGAFERLRDGGGLRELYRRGDAVDYCEGERPPRPA